MEIQIATLEDVEILTKYDRHIARQELENIIALTRVYIARENGQFVGWLRYGLFWDNTPFCNILFLLEGQRSKGYGRQIMERWEKDMKLQGYSNVMTSTPSDETAQHFYARLGYEVTGAFRPEGEVTELILAKNI